MSVSAGGGQGDLGGGEPDAGGELFITAAGLRAPAYKVVARIDGAGRIESNGIVGFFDVLEHDDAIGSGGYGGAGHDFPGFAFGQRSGGRLAGVCRSGDGERLVRGSFSGAAGVAIAGGAREGRLIVVSGDGGGEDAIEGVGERDAPGAEFCLLREFARVSGYEGGRLFVAGEFGTHGGNCSG